MEKILKNWLLSKLLTKGEHALILTLRHNPARMAFAQDTLNFTDWQRNIALRYATFSKEIVERFENVIEWDGSRWARARWGADLGDHDFARAARASEMNRFDFDRLCKSYDRHHKKAQKGGE